ncbi:MAG TPA: hypothetical protein VHW94_06405, partial [Candidatus Dormibacteraeota bacterium]|nr:hypothetical protein [Candidatus Dormibacteraeota bacterium]
MTRAASVSIDGAAQVLRPPSDGLAYLRHDRASELTTDPGALTIAGDSIAALNLETEVETEAETRIDASGCAVVPGFVDCHT